MSHSGRNDLRKNVWYGEAIPPRPFPSLVAAKAYHLSAVKEAHRLVTERCNRNVDSKTESLCTDAEDAFTRLGAMAEGEDEATFDEFVGLAEELVGLSKRAKEGQKRTVDERADVCFNVYFFYALLSLLLLYIPIVINQHTTDESWKFISEFLPYTFPVYWWFVMDIYYKGAVKEISRNRVVNEEIERSSLFISKVTLNNVCAFLPPPQPQDQSDMV